MNSNSEMPIFTTGARILFQGDSITDGNRGRNEDPNHILGHGYAFIIAALFGAKFPERQLEFMNRGVSGNKVTDLAARWQSDTLDLQPDILSILIGVNDACSMGGTSAVSVKQYHEIYDRLLHETRESFPAVKLVLGEPFVTGDDISKTIKADVLQRQEIVAHLALKYHAALVRYQQVFDEANRRAPAEYWIWDGVHPTYSGHQLLADEWVRTVSEFKF